MYKYLMCSNCGRTRRVSGTKPQNITDAVLDVILEGWNSFGAALYCPECVRTWHDRNKKPLAGADNTFKVILKW